MEGSRINGPAVQKAGKILFYIALSVEILVVLLDKSNYINPVESYLFRFTFVLFGLKILSTRYTVKQWAVMMAMAGLGFVSYRATGRNDMLRTVVFLSAMKDMDVRSVVKTVFLETAAGCLVIIALSATGIYGGIAVTGQFRGGGIEETRYCFGMGHPNALHAMFWAVMTLALCLYHDRLKWYAYLLAGIFNLLLYLLTDSRTGMLIGLATVLLAAFLRYFPAAAHAKWLFIAGIVFVAAVTGLSVFIAVYGVDFPVLRQIDIRLNGRFQWARTLGGVQDWSLFSGRGNQNYFDMGFVKLFYWYGIVPGLLYIVWNCLTIWECFRKKDPAAFMVIMVFTAYTFLEAHAVSVYLGRNYVLLFIGAMWYSIISSEREEQVYLPGIFAILKKKVRQG